MNNNLNKMKKFTSKYYLKKEIEIIINSLYDIKRAFQLYKEILSNDDDNNIVLKKFPYITSILTRALEEKFILGLYKTVFDKDKDDNNICIVDIVEKYKSYQENFKERYFIYFKNSENKKRTRRNLEPKKVDACIDKIKIDLIECKDISIFLRNFRRKRLAHLDKKYSFNSKIKFGKYIITYQDIDNVINLMLDDINDLYNCLYGTSYVFIYNELDELKYLKEIVNKELNNKYKKYNI